MQSPTIQAQIQSARSSLPATPGNGPFFIAAMPIYVVVDDPSEWVLTKAVTLAGAKRLAVQSARHVTYSVSIATKNANGEFSVAAKMDNSCAITRRRAFWI